MATLIVYLDAEKKSRQIITPLKQGAEFDSKERFDGKWRELALHLSNGIDFGHELIN